MARKTARRSARDARAIPEFGKRRGRRRSGRGLDVEALHALAELQEGAEAAWSGWRKARWLCWRYRYQVAPLVTILGLWATGAVLHHVQHGGRVAAIAGAVGVGLVWLPGRHVLPRRIERAYATACVLAAVAWLGAAAVHGAWRPMPAILWPAGCALAGPWWWHYRIRGGNKEPDSSMEELWNERVAASGGALPHSRLTDVQRIRNGRTATILLPAGRSQTDTAVAATGLVTSAFEKSIGSVSIEPTDDGIASRAKLLVLDRNPLHEVHPWPGPSLDMATGITHIGVYSDGGLVPFRYYQPGSGTVHDLIAGTTGSGKSRLLDQIIATTTHSGLGVVWLIDPQNGQSLPQWIDHVDWAATDPAEAKRVLRAAKRVMLARSRHLARLEWTDEHGRTLRGKAHFDPTPDMPYLHLVIEEAHETLKDPECVQLVEDIGKMARKTGLKLTLVTQVPSVMELGGSSTIRAMASSGNVIVLRTSDRLSGQMAFNGALPVDPATLPRSFPDGSPTSGLGFAVGAATRPVAMRAYFVDDPHRWATTAPGTFLDLVSLGAAGADYRNREERRNGDPFEELVRPEPPAGQPPGGRCSDAVLAVLPDDGSDLDRGEIIKRSGYSIRAVTDALRELVEDGRVIRTGHGRYARAAPA